MNQDNNTFVPSNPNAVNPNQGAMPQTGVTTVANAGQVAPTVTAQVAVTAQPQVTAQEQNPVVAAAQPVNTNPNILICSKCGSEMKKESRYCMKCGNLNYAHPDNESMKQYAWQSIKQGHFISGANLDDKQPLSMTKANSNSVSNANPFKACLITNIILHVLMAAALIFLANVPYTAINASLPVGAIIGIVVVALIMFILNYSFQAMYIKAGEPWWGYYVPIYSNYILYKIAFGNGWLFLTMLIPVVGGIISLVALYHLGRKFYKNGWLTLLFPVVMIPIIGLDKNSEYSLLARAAALGSGEVDPKGKTQSEKEYGRKKFFITAIVVVVLAVALYFVWPYLQPVVEKLYSVIMEKVAEMK